ncbi:MAG: hypothetical protein WA051_01360 [Minisyncoccia bacterium]
MSPNAEIAMELVDHFLFVARRFGFVTESGALSVDERANFEVEMASRIHEIISNLRVREQVDFKHPRIPGFRMPRRVGAQSMCKDCPLLAGNERSRHSINAVVHAEDVNHLAIAWGCKLHKLDFIDVRFAEVMDGLRNLAVSTLRALGYSVDPSVDTGRVIWPANNRWHHLAINDGASRAHIGAIKGHIRKLQVVARSTPAEQFSLRVG